MGLNNVEAYTQGYYALWNFAVLYRSGQTGRVLAHELGHLMYHPEGYSPDRKEYPGFYGNVMDVQRSIVLDFGPGKIRETTAVAPRANVGNILNLIYYNSFERQKIGFACEKRGSLMGLEDLYIAIKNVIQEEDLRKYILPAGSMGLGPGT
jgi:hypothetical protein